jgi:hypothetical protein
MPRPPRGCLRYVNCSRPPARGSLTLNCRRSAGLLWDWGFRLLAASASREG